jgi:hypothetical protein
VNRPGTKAHDQACDHATAALRELVAIWDQIDRAWKSEDPAVVHDSAGRARGTIQAVIARLEKADRAVMAMRDQILNGEPVE